MNLTLRRTSYNPDGIFGMLFGEDGVIICYTLEHSYDCKPKLQPGQYVCVRGEHQLEGHAFPFETFEITGVDGHFGILFHVGNYHKDSSGCVLLGTAIAGNMLTNSRMAFDKFMALLKGIDSFTLTVKS